MSKKLIKVLTLVLTLILFSVSLVACFSDDDNAITPPPHLSPTYNTSELFSEAINKLVNSFSVDSYTNLSFDINSVIQLRKRDNKGYITSGSTYGSYDFAYQLILKGNVGLGVNSTENDDYILLEINDIARNLGIMRLYFESQANVIGDKSSIVIPNGSYAYISILGSDIIKTNTSNLLSVINLLSPQNKFSFQSDTLTIDNFLSILSFFIADGTITANTYSFNIDISNIWTFIYELLNDKSKLEELTATTPIGKLNVNLLLAQIDSLITNYFSDLSYMQNGTQIAVQNLCDLTQYINQNLPTIKFDINFTFDEANKFINLNSKLDVKQKNDVNGFVLECNINSLKINNAILSKSEILKSSFISHHFANLNDRFAMLPVNILNFKLTGNIDYYCKSINFRTFAYTVNADINPDSLANGFTMATLKNLGYFHLNFTDKADGKSVLDIYIDTAADMLLINIDFGSTVGLSAIYSIESLLTIINDMPPLPPNADAAKDSSIFDLLQNHLDLSDIYNNGLILEHPKRLINRVIKHNGIDLNTAKIYLNSIYKDLFGGSYQSISLEATKIHFTINDINSANPGFIYGGCEKINPKSITLTGKGSAFGSGVAVSEVKPLTKSSIQTFYEYGEPFAINYITDADSMNTVPAQSIWLDGKDLNGNQVHDLARIYSYDFDSTVVGTQKARIYYGSNSKLGLLWQNIDSISNFFAFPLYGIQYFELDVTVNRVYNNTETIILPSQSNIVGLNENIADTLDAYLYYGDRTVKVTSDMITCAKPLIKDGKAVLPGTFTLQVNYKNAIFGTIDIKVGGIITNTVQSLNLGDNLADKLNVTLHSYSDNGIFSATKYDLAKAMFKLGGIDTNISALFDDCFVLKQDNSFINKTLTITFSYIIYNTLKTYSITIPISMPCS